MRLNSYLSKRLPQLLPFHAPLCLDVVAGSIAGIVKEEEDSCGWDKRWMVSASVSIHRGTRYLTFLYLNFLLLSLNLPSRCALSPTIFQFRCPKTAHHPSASFRPALTPIGFT